MNKESKRRIHVLSEEISKKTVMVRAIARGSRFDLHQIIKLCSEIDRAIDVTEKEDRAAELN